MTRKELVTTYALISLFTAAILAAVVSALSRNLNTGLIVGAVVFVGSFVGLLFNGGAHINEVQ